MSATMARRRQRSAFQKKKKAAPTDLEGPESGQPETSLPPTNAELEEKAAAKAAAKAAKKAAKGN